MCVCTKSKRWSETMMSEKWKIWRKKITYCYCIIFFILAFLVHCFLLGYLHNMWIHKRDDFRPLWQKVKINIGLFITSWYKFKFENTNHIIWWQEKMIKSKIIYKIVSITIIVVISNVFRVFDQGMQISIATFPFEDW